MTGKVTNYTKLIQFQYVISRGTNIESSDKGELLAQQIKRKLRKLSDNIHAQKS